MLKNTKTAQNLMKSFAGESQARNRYTFYSDIAKAEGYIEISNTFKEIAEQEKEHAKIFFDFLKDEFQDQQVEFDASYPVALHNDTASNLRAAINGEHGEGHHYYPEFSNIAREEGLDNIAKAYEKITKIEKTHEKRFATLLENLENKTLFKKDIEVSWKCNNCGYVHEGKSAPDICPACSHPQGYFEVFVL